MDQFVDRARRFNRFYTRAIGMLGEGYLGSGFSLAEARVIYELATRAAPAAAEIGAVLGLDRGYLSRILKRLEARGLVARARAADDRRQQRLSLTPEGRAVFADLDEGARRSMARLAGHLGAEDLQRLAGAMAEIEGLLAERPAAEVVLRGPRPGDLGWVVERHAVLYARDQGWGPGFEVLVARIVAEMMQAPDPARERCWIAERNGERLGCVFLARDSEAVARLRLLLVEPAARGLGLGRRLAEAAVDFAHEAGYREVVLWTHAELAAARRIYAALGFEKTEEWTHADFGPPAVSETWRLALPRAAGRGA